MTKRGRKQKSKLRLLMADTIKKCVQIKVKVKFFLCVPNVAWQQMVNHFSTGNRLPSVSFLDSLYCGMYSAVLEFKALNIKVTELLDPIIRYLQALKSKNFILRFGIFWLQFKIFRDFWCKKTELFHSRILYPGQNNFHAEKTAEVGIDFVLLRL